MKSFTILGVDPGIANCGFAVVKGISNYNLMDTELVKTPSTDETGKRLETIHDTLSHLLDTHTPSGIAIEQVFHNKNVRSSISTGKVIGLVEHTAYMFSLPVFTFTPQQIKASSGFGGNANKAEILRVASGLFRTTFKSHHVADAAFAAISGILKMRKNEVQS